VEESSKLQTEILTSEVTLSNGLTLNGGTLSIFGDNLTFNGNLAVNSTATINNETKNSLNLGNVSGTGTLTLEGFGVTNLTGTLDGTPLSVTGNVKLRPTFGDGSSPGSITVLDGGKLSSAGVGTFTGTITLTSGTLVPLGNNAFGTGKLIVTPAGPVAINSLGASVLLGNFLQLNGGSLVISPGSLTFSQQLTLNGNSTIQTSGGKLTLQSGTTGNFTLTMTGSDTFSLSGELLSTKLVVPTKKQVVLLSVTGSGTVFDAQNDQLYPS
jgi:hypothetical protein